MTDTTENTPMTWEQAMKEKAAEQARRKAALSTGPKYVSFKSGVLSIDKTPIPDNTLDVVVLSFISENTYYKGRYDASKPQTPACWAIYDDSENMVPHGSCKDPQAENCESCDFFKWNSDPQGGRGKACKTRVRLALIPASFVDPIDVLTAELRFGTLPVTSGKDFDGFMSKCDNLYGLPSFAMIATLKVVPDSKSQFKVMLEPKGKIAPTYMENILKRVEEAERTIWYEYTDSEGENNDTAAAKTSKKL